MACRILHAVHCEGMKKTEKIRTSLAALRMDLGTADYQDTVRVLATAMRMVKRGEIDAPKARNALAKMGCVYLGPVVW